MQQAILSAIALLLVGFTLRATVRPLRWLHVPASVVAGFLGFGVVALLGLREGGPPPWVANVVAEFKTWPTPLIAIVFAGLLMEHAPANTASAVRDVVRQGLAAWVVILGQVCLGALATWLVIGPMYHVPPAFGQLIEVGMAGGPGTANAMGDVYAQQFDFPEGRSLGVFVATFGLVWGVLSGIVLVNVGVRRGWVASREVVGPEFVSGLEPAGGGKPIGIARVRSDVIDPLMFQALLLGAAFGIGWLMQWGWSALLSTWDDPANKRQLVDNIAGLPLFLFTMAGGWFVRRALQVVKLGHLIDAGSLQRLTGIALELVIVASVTTISLRALSAYFWPVALLLTLGCAWCVFNLVWVSPRVLPRRYWFELGLMNYGFATATTSQSLLLLRMADRHFTTGAAETYAAAVPLSAPFIGGGVVTFLVFPLMAGAAGAWSVALVTGAATIVLYALARRLHLRAADETRLPNA